MSIADMRCFNISDSSNCLTGASASKRDKNWWQATLCSYISAVECVLWLAVLGISKGGTKGTHRISNMVF